MRLAILGNIVYTVSACNARMGAREGRYMSTQAKVSVIGHSIAAAVVIALMGIASVYDLQISRAIGDPNSFFGQFFAIYAEYPSYMVAPLCATVLFYNADRATTRTWRIAARIGAAVLCYGGYGVFGLMSTKLVEVPHQTAFAFVASGLYAAITLALGKCISRETMHRLLRFAVFALVFLLVALAVIRLMKFGWCRMRYRDMLKEGNFDGFTPWYIPMLGREKLSDAYSYTSFPSGHSSSIVHLFLITVLCDILPCMRKPAVRYICYGGCIVLTVLACVSRIVNCAHFLSDVVAGASITYVIFYILKRIFFPPQVLQRYNTESDPKGAI